MAALRTKDLGCFALTEKLPNFDLEHYLPYQFSIVAAQLSASFAKLYQDKFGISITEWRILINLAYSDSRSVRDIQKRVHLDKAKVSRSVARLERRGLLTKEVDTSDRRLLILELTHEGEQLVTHLVPLARDFQAQLSQKLGDETTRLQSQLSHLMKELSDDETL